MELNSPGDAGHAALAGFAGGVVVGFPGLAGAGAVRAVPDGEAGPEDLEQERGQGKVGLVRGKAVTVSVAAARARGKLIFPGGMPAALAPMPMSLHIAW